MIEAFGGPHPIEGRSGSIVVEIVGTSHHPPVSIHALMIVSPVEEKPA